MGKPSKGTPKDKRLKTNKQTSGSSRGGSASGKPFGGSKSAPFKRGGGRKK